MDISDSELQQLRDVFLAETGEQLSAMEEGLMALEERPDDRERLDDVFRAAHTLKGNASSMGFDGVAALAHDTEGLLDRLRTQEVTATASIVSLLLQAVDVTRQA